MGLWIVLFILRGGDELLLVKAIIVLWNLLPKEKLWLSLNSTVRPSRFLQPTLRLIFVTVRSHEDLQLRTFLWPDKKRSWLALWGFGTRRSTNNRSCDHTAAPFVAWNSLYTISASCKWVRYPCLRFDRKSNLLAPVSLALPATMGGFTPFCCATFKILLSDAVLPT